MTTVDEIFGKGEDLPAGHWIDKCANYAVMIDKLQRENEELKKDAERYRWLCRNHHHAAYLFSISSGAKEETDWLVDGGIKYEERQ